MPMPDWKDRSNPQFGRRRAVARRQGAVRVRPGSAWQRALAVARERRPRHFAEWQASDAVCHRRRAIDFRALPRSCDPLWGGGVPPIRAWRKRRQIENVLGPLAELTALLERPAHIVDFCASSGHVALPAAAVLKGVTVEINDLRERPIDIARERIAALPPALRARCTARVGSTETHTGPFDIGVALHACGVATDVVLEACLRRRAAFVLVPCCVGRLAQRANRGRNARSSLPKTEAFAACFDLPKSAVWRGALTSDEAKALARAGDCTARDKLTTDDRERRACKTVIDGDRLALAAERGYTVSHFVMRPFGITPKNDVIVGYPSEWRDSCTRD